jgi:hypothetical protein
MLVDGGRHSVAKKLAEPTLLREFTEVQVGFRTLELLSRNWHGLVLRLRRGDAAVCQRRDRQDWHYWFEFHADVLLLY